MSQNENSMVGRPPIGPVKNEGVDVNLQQLNEIYNFISETFHRDVESNSDVYNIIKHFIKKYNKLSKTNDELKEDYDVLQQEFFDNKNQTEDLEAFNYDIQLNEEKARKKLKQLKQELQDMKDKNQELELALEESRTQIRELKINKEEIESAKSKLEHDLSRTRNNLTSMEIPQQQDDKKDKAEYIDEVSSAYNELVDSYKQLNDTLMSQRDTLVEKCIMLNDCLGQSQKYLEDSNLKIEEITRAKESAENRVQELSTVVPDLAQQVEQMIPHEFRAKLPQMSGDYSNYILDVVDQLANMKIDTEPIVESRTISDEDNEKKKYMILLSHLEDCLRFIQNIGNSGSYDPAGTIQPLGVDSQVRTELLKQCARIGQFIDANIMELGAENIAKGFSLFEVDSFNKAENLLNEFLSFATEEQLSESPIRELFAVFTAVCEVNKMMMNFTERLQKEAKQHEKLPVNSNLIRDLQRDNFDLANWKAVNQEKLDKVQKVLEDLTGDKDTALDVMALKLDKKYEDVACENDELIEKIRLLEEELDFVRKDKVDMENELSSRIIENDEKLKSEEDAFKKLRLQVKSLTKENNLLKKKTDTKIASLEKEVGNKTQKLKDAEKKNAELERKNASNQETLKALTAEREGLLQQFDQMQQLILQREADLGRAKEKERKLRESRESLKEKLANSDSTFKSKLEDIRGRNEEVQQKYDQTIKQLQEELEDFRQDTINVHNDAVNARKEKAELEKQITTLRVQEKAMKLRYDTLIEKQNLEKKAMEAKNTTYLASLKAQSEKKIEEISSILTRIKNAIANVLTERFGEEIKDDIEVQELLSRLDRRLNMFAGDKRVLQEAIALRGELKLLPTQTLHEAFISYQQAKENAENNFNRVSEERHALELEVAKIKKATEKYGSEYKQAGEWEIWGKSLYKQISTNKVEPASLDELRFKLAEAVLVTLEDRSTIRRIETLRAQKKIQNSEAFRDGTASKKAELSIKSVIDIINFTQRLFALKGIMPLSTALSPRRSY